MKRKIAAILAADAAEYSRLVAEDEEQAVRQLVASIEVFKTSIETHGGRIFNTAGDAVLAEFQSAVEAVRSAIDIQERLGVRNEAYAPGRRMMFRMGISIGDVVENGSDLLGDGVNIAARLQTLSQPGGLAISRWVQEQVAGKVGREFRDTGYQLVKNMPSPIHVFQTSLAAVEPSQPELPPAAPLSPAAESSSSPARRWRLGVLAAGLPIIAIAIVLFVLARREPSPAAIPETSPALAKQEVPASVPVSVQQLPDRPVVTPGQRPSYVTPEEAFARREERGPQRLIILPPSSSTPAAPAAREEPPLASAPSTSREASAPPSAAVLDGGNAGARQFERPRDIVEPPASGLAADRKQQKNQCAEILERAQLGELTSDDRAVLRNQCR